MAAGTLVRFCVTAALLQLYVYGVVPLVMLDVMDPFGLPHVASVGASVTAGGVEGATVALAVVVQLLASVTVTVYVPAAMPVKFWVVAALLQL